MSWAKAALDSGEAVVLVPPVPAAAGAGSPPVDGVVPVEVVVVVLEELVAVEVV